MAQVTLEINGILRLQKRVAKVISRTLPKFGIFADAVVKFGVSPQDAHQKTYNFLMAQNYYHAQLRKIKRKELYLRKFHQRGERMRKHGRRS